jgi:hypothetical protein
LLIELKASEVSLPTGADLGARCEMCHPTCSTCTGPFDTHCLSCAATEATDSASESFVASGKCESPCDQHAKTYRDDGYIKLFTTIRFAGVKFDTLTTPDSINVASDVNAALADQLATLAAGTPSLGSPNAAFVQTEVKGVSGDNSFSQFELEILVDGPFYEYMCGARFSTEIYTRGGAIGSHTRLLP